MTEETSFWKGSSSQWLNLGHFTAALVVAGGIAFAAFFFPLAWVALVLPILYALWRYLIVRTEVYELTTERLRVFHGVINQTIDEIELYRVKDLQMARPWWMRLTGLASIIMETSDRSIPRLVIPAVRGGEGLREILRQNVELQRDRKRVRETDFDDAGGESVDFA